MAIAVVLILGAILFVFYMARIYLYGCQVIPPIPCLLKGYECVSNPAESSNVIGGIDSGHCVRISN